MKRISGIILCLTIIVMSAFCSTASGTQASYYFKHYDISQGLSLNTVLALHQDTKGFIWIGTKNGLNRFDGSQFKVFLKGNKAGMLHNSMIYSIAEDSQQRLWVATDAGISIYDPKGEKFTSFNSRTEHGQAVSGAVNRIIVDRNDTVWILSGNELFMYSIREDRLTLLNTGLHEHTVFRPFAIHMDERKNLLYIGVPVDGLYSYNPETEEYTHIASCPYTPTDICIYKHNFALVGTINHGVYIVNLATGESRPMRLQEDTESSLFVRVIRKISENEYWIGTESGIYIVKDGDVQHLEHEKFYDQSISNNAIYAIMPDKDNGIWIGSYFGGVDYISNRHPYFRSITPKPYSNSISGFRVREFVEDNRGDIWIATEDNGLNRFSTASGGYFRNVTTGDNYIPFNNIQCLNLDGDKLWAGTFSKGIYVMDLNTLQTEHYQKSLVPYSLDNNDIFAICTDSDGTTWAGSSSGASVFLPEKRGFLKFDKTGYSFISDIMEDSEGYIWFATFNSGVFRYDKKKDQIQNFRHEPGNPCSLCYDRIISIYEDSEKRMWFASEDGGFCRFDRIDETFTTISTEDGLPSNVIHKIIEDDSGHLWLSTNNGIVHFDPSAMSVIDIYNQFNGLPSRQFNYNSGYKAKDGTIYFGSINGFVSFNPKIFSTPAGHYNVVFTDFEILGLDEDCTGKADFADLSIPYTSSIRLSHRQNSFSLSFSAFDYSRKGYGQYAYKLEGAENSWNYISDKVTTISYNRINPGNYNILIKYSPDGHTWDGDTTSLAICIRPPFWNTKLARILFIIIALGIIVSAVRLIVNRREKDLHNELLRQEQNKKEEIYKAKIDFFTNIAHEIRTPITLIKVPLDHLLKTEPGKEELKENLMTMERNANRLLVLVNQLLDFRKIESDAMTLSLKKKNINEILAATFSRFLSVARQKNIDMTVSYPAPIYANVDEEAIIKICSNLFNNAIKHAESYIKVELSRNDEYNYFQISIHNDGEKIPEDMRGRIFEAFFQIKSTHQSAQPGSGIGLTLASSLTKLHNGNLFIDENAEDTAFVIQIPENLGTEENATNASEDTQTTDNETYVHESDNDIENKVHNTILIVEDNDELLNLLVQQLEVHYTVIPAVNGVEAMKILEKDIVNLIVSDVMMPLMDGFELCRKVKSSLHTCHIPIILLTAKTNLSDKIAGLEKGADAYIVKPFSTSYLLAQIENLLKNRASLIKKFTDNPLLGTNIIAQNKEDEKFIRHLTDVINQNLSNDMFGVDELASEMNMSRSNLHRKMRGVTGMAPVNFILILRMKKAAELLLEGGYRINEVCMLVGINSSSYFSKSFLKQFGVLPKDYARSIRDKR